MKIEETRNMAKMTDVKTLQVWFGDYTDEQPCEITVNGKHYETCGELAEDSEMAALSAERFPGFREVCIEIDVETGHVRNWPLGNPVRFYDLKVCDGGRYVMIDEKGEVINSHKGYAPLCLSDVYGDYFMFEIDGNSDILDFNFSEADFEALMEEGEEE